MNTTTLCSLDSIPDGSARGFELDEETAILVVRQGEQAWAYINRCPHVGVQLNWMPDQFMSLDNATLQCSMHGAQFRIQDGFCIYGPCVGRSLEPLPLALNGDQISVSWQPWQPDDSDDSSDSPTDSVPHPDNQQ